MKKILGYILSALGIIFLLLTFDSIKKALSISLPPFLTTATLTVISLIILAVGVFILIKSKSSSAPKEVPIYQGDKVVGYRRTQ